MFNTIFAVVVLPEPFGPIKVTICPFETSRETPLTNHLEDLYIPAFSNLTK